MQVTFERVMTQKDNWYTKVHSQYAMAYNDAYLKLKEVVTKAEAEEKEKAEFFATIVAIMSCSVGVAVLGEAWLNRLVIRTGLRTLGVANTRAVVNWVRHGHQPAVVGFLFGKAVDTVKDTSSDKFKKITASLVQHVTSGLTETDPLNRSIELNNLLIYQSHHLLEMAKAIEQDRSLSVSQKAASTAALNDAPFWHEPANPIGKEKLAKKIELAFHMNTVLSGDHILVNFPPDMRTPPQRGDDITLMPSDKNYPRNQRFEGRLGTYNTVEIDRPAMAFQERIDELHKEIFKGPFYETAYWKRVILPNSGMGQPQELVKAEQTLDRLSALTRPANAMIVAF